jgi:GDP-4-dehydro-6-deoxy-D-mannose reductase
MRILVTGGTGFAGGHLVDELAGRSAGEIFGLSRRPAGEQPPEHLAGKLARLYPCDLADRGALEAVVRDARPDRIFHLAGYARVGRSFQEPDAAWDANLAATRNLYEAILRWGGRPRVLFVSSGLIYGDAVDEEGLIGEDRPLRPVSPYAASKAAADLASFQYGCSGLEIIRVRPFNHLGPRQPLGFAVPDFAHQLAAIERGLHPPLLETGDLSARRDLTDVRDMVRAYADLMDRGQPGEAYNVGTGVAHAMRDVLDQLLGLAHVRVEVRQDPRLIRTQDTPALRADAGNLRRATGWAPRLPLGQTLADTLEYWRSVVARRL